MKEPARPSPRLALVAEPPVARDPRIARALDAIVSRLDVKWTVRALGRIAGASRAAFVRLFEAELGTPPMQFIREQRLARAAARLRDSDITLASLATETGYGTEFALSRAFKKHFGLAPTPFRKAAREGRVTAISRAA